MRLLMIAIIIDGRLARREKELWKQASAACGISCSFELPLNLLYHFKNGKEVSSEWWRKLNFQREKSVE